MVVLDLFVQLESLKKERDSVISTHYYQDSKIAFPEVIRLQTLIPLESMLDLS